MFCYAVALLFVAFITILKNLFFDFDIASRYKIVKKINVHVSKGEKILTNISIFI